VSQTVFQKVEYQLSTLIDSIGLGEIGLPDLQRPFVWDASKVRDLFDSMYRGFPVGHLLFWESGAEPGARQIGTGNHQVVPRLLIVDGQQRLTSLYAVMRQQPIIGRDYKVRPMNVAFRPRDGFFAVADAANERDSSFLQDIGEIWMRPAFTVITEFLNRLEHAGPLDAEGKEQIANALNRLESLKAYAFTVLVLGAEVDEEQVAEVFVRINSKGKNLNQADFILTLMSVFWDEGRKNLENFSRSCRTADDAASNHYLQPDPDQLLRVAIALGFRRGRLENAYAVLRGRDANTGVISPEARDAQFARLNAAQERVLDKRVWKEFLQALLRAGHRSSSTISSDNAILYAYALFLVGKHDFSVPAAQLRDVIARWFFMSTLTGRYSSSPESTVESDLSSLPASGTAEEFVGRLDDVIGQRLTNDFWDINLPNELATSASRSPALFSYMSALTLLNAPVLFSRMTCSELLDPAFSGGRSRIERHHLFPKHHLARQGISDIKQVNQIANYALLEWHDNLAISATDPAVYWPAYLAAMRNPPSGMPAFSEEQIARMLFLHGLSESWPALPYEEFLSQRRRAIAQVVREAYERLAHGLSDTEATTWPPSSAAVEHLLRAGETQRVELKSSLRADTAGRGVPARALEKVVARTIAGFLNHDGGLLVIGADDAGTPLGLDRDLETLQRKDLDGFQQTLVQVLASYLGTDVAASVDIHLTQVGPDSRTVALVNCPPSSKPVYLRDAGNTEFHVRAANTTRLMDVAETASYVGRHWSRAA
jgi:hypothetical protein